MQRWYVIFTKPRREQEAAEQLTRQGYEIYLPLIEQQKRRRGKWRPVIEPLFSRYIFIYVDPNQVSIAPVRSTLGVTDFVRFGGVICQVPSEVIEFLKAGEDPERGLIQPHRPRFAKGDKVEMVDGPFAGMSAIFEQEKGEDRALVLIDMLGKVNRVMVERDRLVPVE